jgi:hypothetical protein
MVTWRLRAVMLTGESVDGTLSSEITAFRVPTLCLNGEGNIDRSDSGVMEGPGGVLASWHAWIPSARESGDPCFTEEPDI